MATSILFLTTADLNTWHDVIMISLLWSKILPGALEGNNRPGKHRSYIQYKQELMREQNTAEHN